MTIKNFENTWVKRLIEILLGFIIMSTPAFAQQTPIDAMIIGLRNAGFQLVLLWLFALAVVYGILSHIELPKSITARGVISIVASFMVLIAAAGTQAATFLSNLATSSIVVGFGLIVTMIFLEITQTKAGGEHIFSKHPRFFGAALIIIAILVFIGAGGLNFIAIPALVISNSVFAIGVFLIVIVASVWILVKETKSE